MDADRLRRTEELFHAARELAPGARAVWLEDACAGDPGLRAEVEALLDAEAGSPGFLEQPPAASSDAESEEPPPPAAIGPYRLLREIGRGGMGRVYLAEQEGEAFRRRVAIKLLAWAGPFRDRFRAEQRILAALEHPGIARLYDGGTTADGRQFLALEYVEGENLVAHCASRELPLRERIELFRQVCAAVDYAHRHLVVHRDLKPANILVTTAGAPKLLDFGIAKLLQQESGAEGAAETVAGQRLMTPRYASPEQVRGETVSTASDVYSLGVILYELLTGAAPYRVTTGSADEISRAVLEQEPKRPSTAASAGGERAPVAPRRLRGDLDTIVLKALAKDPSRRYGTAAELAEDLERHLEGRPVRARPDQLGYRVRKFAVRHRVGVAAAAVALVSLVAGAGAATWQAAAARRAEAAARADAETALQISEFLVDLFRINEPGATRGNAVTARELLDRGAERIEAQLADQPAVRARLLRAIGRAYGELGLYEPAAAALERELAAESSLHGADSREVAATLAVLAAIQMKQGAYAKARDASRRALSLQERASGADELAIADSLSQLGIAHWYLGELGEARRALERSLALREQRLGPDHADLGGILNNVAILRAQEGDQAGAIALYERALRLFEREHGEDHPSVARTLNNLAIVHLEAGDAARARALHQRALDARRRVLAAGHPEIAESLNNLGEALRAAGELEPARAALAEALAIRERALGPDHPHVGTTLHNLGITLSVLGADAEARALLERALAVFAAALGDETFQVGYVLAALAELDRRAGAPAAAERRWRRSLELLERSLPPGHRDLAETRRGYAKLLRELGRAAEAAALEALARPPAAAVAR